MAEPLVELYSKDDCHLCDNVKNVMLNVRKRIPFHLVEIKIREGMEEYERFKDRVPVVYIDKRFGFQYRVGEKEFVKMLQKK